MANPAALSSDGRSADIRDVHAICVRGDEAAFRSLYRRHTPALYAFACRLMGGESAEVEDVLQDAWLRASRALGDFGWRSSLRTWLSSIVLNCCRERWRERGESLEAAPEAVVSTDHGLRLDIEAALASLPPGYRAVLVLHDIEGYTHDEIAERLGIRPGTSKSQLFHARRAVRQRLAGDPQSAREN
ncbi:MAG TPA: RNA polymerase sigma factor [Gemmatimonadaceae bacterium]|nr:RNA polymerase sigma factor [Gemmatimonadaceae bacterium]